MKSVSQYKQHILDGLVQLGLGQPALSAYAALTQSRDLRTVCHVEQEVISAYSAGRHNESIIIPIISTNPVEHYVLASALKIRGYNPIMFTNMGSLPIETTFNYWKEQAQFAVKNYNLEKFEAEFKIPVRTIDEILTSNYNCHSVNKITAGDEYYYDDMDISNYAVASARRYLQRYRLDSSSAYHNNVYRDLLKAGIMLADVTERLIQRHEVIAGILTETSYVHGGVVAEILRKYDKSAYSYGRGRITNHVSLGLGRNNHLGNDFDPLDVVKSVREYNISNADRTLLRDRLPQTSNESMRYSSYVPEGDTGLPQSERFTVGVFSHLPWDGALAPSEALFPNFYEWLGCTVETLTNYPEMDVYVKAHPAESKRGTKEYVGDWLADNYPNLPSNIRFIPPDSRISFYRMISELDAGIVYASTVGAEMAYNNIPVLIGGYPPYIDYGIGFAPSNKIEFVNLLERLPELVVTPQMQARCERFLYHLFVNKQMSFPISNLSTGESMKINYELLMSKDITKIIDSVISGETVQRFNYSS